MSGLETAIGLIVLILGTIYTVTALIVYGHVDKNKTYNRAIIYAPFWPFYPDIYDDAGKALCTPGKWMFVTIWVGVFLLLIIS